MLKKENLFVDFDASDVNDLFEKMGGAMVQRGYAKESFIQGLKDREAEFPTGLALAEHAIAIPHTYPEHIEIETVAVALLKNPVEFIMMGSNDQVVNAQLIFMLLLKSKAQLPMLQKIMGIIQDPKTMDKLIACKDSDEMYQQLKDLIVIDTELM